MRYRNFVGFFKIKQTNVRRFNFFFIGIENNSNKTIHLFIIFISTNLTKLRYRELEFDRTEFDNIRFYIKLNDRTIKLIKCPQSKIKRIE